MITCKVGKMRRNNNLCFFHNKQAIDIIIEEHNKVVDALDIAYNEINRLLHEIEILKAGEQNG